MFPGITSASCLLCHLLLNFYAFMYLFSIFSPLLFLLSYHLFSTPFPQETSSFPQYQLYRDKCPFGKLCLCFMSGKYERQMPLNKTCIKICISWQSLALKKKALFPIHSPLPFCFCYLNLGSLFLFPSSFSCSRTYLFLFFCSPCAGFPDSSFRFISYLQDSKHQILVYAFLLNQNTHPRILKPQFFFIQ